MKKPRYITMTKTAELLNLRNRNVPVRLIRAGKLKGLRVEFGGPHLADLEDVLHHRWEALSREIARLERDNENEEHQELLVTLKGALANEKEGWGHYV